MLFEKKIGDLGKIINGGTPSTANESFWNGEIPWITPNDLSNYDSKWIKYGERNITKEGLEKSSAKYVPAESILISTRAPVGYVVRNEIDASTNQGIKAFVPNPELVNANYMYYYFKKNTRLLNLRSGGTTFRELSTNSLKFIDVLLPDLETQTKTGDIISVFDDKIELNKELISSLEEYSQLLFHKWFVDFNFPNEEGKPYKNEGGELTLVNNQLVPKGWEHLKLGDLTNITTGKKDANHATEDGQYPFYTCSSEQLNSPTYSFDTKAMILAGNGEFWFNRYEGKFEAYQRNYIIESKSDNMFDYLYLNLDKYLNVITSKSAGSIIKYLTMGMITELEVIIPDDITLQKFNKIINPLFTKIDLLKKENTYLEEIRNLLIHKLLY